MRREAVSQGFLHLPRMKHTLSASALLFASLGAISLPASAAFLSPAEIGLVSQKDLYRATWIDFNKNGKMDVFEDPTQPLDKRVEDLLSQMNVEEKTCQLATLYGYRRVLKDPLPTPDWKNQIWKDGIANIDEMHLTLPRPG